MNVDDGPKMSLNTIFCSHWQNNKMHPREWNRDAQFRGRVRVQLKQTDGSLCLEKFTSRESLCVCVCRT